MAGRRITTADDISEIVPQTAVDSAEDGATASELNRQKSDFERMRAHLAKQPKVRVRLREDTFAQLNGYTFLIKANQPVMVPEQVYELLVNAGRV